MTTDTLSLLAPDSPGTWPPGILAAAERVEDDWLQIDDGARWLGAKGDLWRPFHLSNATHWRSVVERHTAIPAWDGEGNAITGCRGCGEMVWPCPDLTETADEARTYLGGAA